MALDDLSKLQGSFGYKLCALYLPQRDKSGTMSEALRMLVGGLGEEWRDKATFDDVCTELELAGVGHAGTMRSVVLAGLGEHIEEEYTNAGPAVRWITEQDRKLGVWVACACAPEALKYARKSWNIPRVAIETAEAWVRGEATKEQVGRAADAAWAAANIADSAYDAASVADRSATYAAYSAACAATAKAAYAGDVAARAATEVASAAYYAAYAAADAAADTYVAWTAGKAAEAAELRRLVSVIARSLQTFPVLLTAPE